MLSFKYWKIKHCIPTPIGKRIVTCTYALNFKHILLMKKYSLFALLLASTTLSIAQVKPLKVKYFYPKDSIAFSKIVPEIDFNYEPARYGKTTMIIHTESKYGVYEFIFKKKINKLVRTINYKSGGVVESYNFKSKKWEHVQGTWKHAEMKGKPQDTLMQSEHHLYALVLLHDHGGLLEKIKFQDFGNEVYWPEFDYKNCSVSDEDKDGKPEFYLSYFGNSDGLDAKPHKQIVYTYQQNGNISKAKATALYPAGNEEDEYQLIYDTAWKALPKAIQEKSKRILQ